MKCIRVIEYEAEDAVELKRHMIRTLLSKRTVIAPGDVVEGVGPIHAGTDAPQVTIRLLSEEWQ